MNSASPTLSLIVASRNEGTHLHNTLRAALAITPPTGGLEISVVDDASSDGSSRFLDHTPWLQQREAGQIRLTRVGERLGVSQARRRGAIGCRGKVLVFLDAHLTFPQESFWLDLLARFDDPRCDLLGVDCFDQRTLCSTAGSVYSSKRLCHQAPTWVPIQSEPLSFQPVPFVNGGFFAIRRHVYEHLEGFPDCLQGWGHEDRLLSMLAGLCGYRCWLDQSLRVGHLYKDAFKNHDGMPEQPWQDPHPEDGVAPPNVQFIHAQQGEEPVPLMLLNSLRCASLLYDEHHFTLTVEQLQHDFGSLSLQQGLDVLAQERPQLDAYLHRVGLPPSLRDQRLTSFLQQFRTVLPMLDEAELHFCCTVPDQAHALDRIRTLPMALPSLGSPDADHYRCARLYRHATCAYACGEREEASARLAELLLIDPDYLPAIRLLSICLHDLNRKRGEQFWLEHGAAVINKHRAEAGPNPIGALHPASRNPYLRDLYWPGVDREIWLSLASWHEQHGEIGSTLRWLGVLLDQTPDDPVIRQWIQRLSSV